jgi:hypothetical protein
MFTQENLRIPAMAAGMVTCGFVAYAAWGIATPGDYFANGSSLVDLSVIAAAAVGLLVGRAVTGRLRIVVLAIGVASLSLWIALPAGWWVKSPPNISLERTREK